MQGVSSARGLLGLTLILSVPPLAQWLNLTELARQLGNMVEHPKYKSTQPSCKSRRIYPYMSISVLCNYVSYVRIEFSDTFFVCREHQGLPALVGQLAGTGL